MARTGRRVGPGQLGLSLEEDDPESPPPRELPLSDPADAEIPTVWVDRSELAKFSSIAAAVIPESLLQGGFSRQGMWLTATPGGIDASASGPELSIRTHLTRLSTPPEVLGDHLSEPVPPGWSVITPARVLARLVPRLSPGPVALGFAPDRLVIRSGRFRGWLRTLDPASQHDPVEGLEVAWEVRIPAVALLDALSHLSVALGSPSARPLGPGGLIVAISGDGTVDLAITDRTHLAIASVPIDGTASTGSIPPPVVLPAGAVEIIRALRTDDDLALVRVGAGRAEITVGSTTVRARLLRWPVPDYRVMTRLRPTHWMNLSQRTLATVMRRVRLLATDQHRAVWFELSRDSAIARTAHGEVGQASDRFPARFTGAHCEIGIGVDVLAAMTRRLPDGRIRLEFDAADKVVSLYSEDRPDLRYYTGLLAVRHLPWLPTDTERRSWEPPKLLPISDRDSTLPNGESGPG